jgi:hypothetical protein
MALTPGQTEELRGMIEARRRALQAELHDGRLPLHQLPATAREDLREPYGLEPLVVESREAL